MDSKMNVRSQLITMLMELMLSVVVGMEGIVALIIIIMPELTMKFQIMSMTLMTILMDNVKPLVLNREWAVNY